MTDTMPEEIWALHPEDKGQRGWGEYEIFESEINTPYRLKSASDVERAADSKTIAALAEALDMIGSESHDSVAASTARLALKNSAPRIEEAKENQK